MTATDTTDAPLITDADILARAESLVGPANDRTLWPFFIDRHDVQLRALIPIDHIPENPPADEIERIVALFAKVSSDWGIGGIAYVIERPGGAEPTPNDVALAENLAEASRRRALPHRATVLVHDTGARLL
ncbi:hypothetical protein HQQ81_14135 [Microbacteriaceae bacterium VKM Ac-2854]|nr:hypothetical protein [Microbacteriaceae bacterium VKM Ac-2854]